jgi:hypothetical protein
VLDRRPRRQPNVSATGVTGRELDAARSPDRKRRASFLRVGLQADPCVVVGAYYLPESGDLALLGRRSAGFPAFGTPWGEPPHPLLEPQAVFRVVLGTGLSYPPVGLGRAFREGLPSCRYGPRQMSRPGPAPVSRSLPG